MSLNSVDYDMIPCCIVAQSAEVWKGYQNYNETSETAAHVNSLYRHTDGRTCCWVVIFRPPIAQSAHAMLMAVEIYEYLDHVY
jgi:hypothetical protein